jgi:hypothetical protein
LQTTYLRSHSRDDLLVLMTRIIMEISQTLIQYSTELVYRKFHGQFSLVIYTFTLNNFRQGTHGPFQYRCVTVLEVWRNPKETESFFATLCDDFVPLRALQKTP